MGRKRSSQQLYVYMNGRMVGTLTKESSSMLNFSYSDDWLSWEDRRPISLSLPLSDSLYSGTKVYHFFDNLLPDNDLIRKRIQARFQINQNHCFDLLYKIGSDCVGAIQLLTETTHEIQKIEGTNVDNIMISKILKDYKVAPLGMTHDSNFRISIAGAQEKTAFLRYQDKWYLPKGTTPTTHIFKLPIGYITHSGIDLSESCENEWLSLKILEAYNLPINKVQIELFEDMKALVIERFDRRFSENQNWIIRLPQEDICQVLGISSALKYESDGGPGIIEIMNILRGALNVKQDREQFMKSVFLFWVLGAIDGHAKNFSISIERQGNYRLSPLYDVISAYPLIANHQFQRKNFKMAMSLKGTRRHYRWHEIQLRHWLSMSKLCQFPESTMQIIIEEVCDNMEKVIEKVKEILPSSFPNHISNPIFEGMINAKNVILSN